MTATCDICGDPAVLRIGHECGEYSDLCIGHISAKDAARIAVEQP